MRTFRKVLIKNGCWKFLGETEKTGTQEKNCILDRKSCTHRIGYSSLVNQWIFIRNITKNIHISCGYWLTRMLRIPIVITLSINWQSKTSMIQNNRTQKNPLSHAALTALPELPLMIPFSSVRMAVSTMSPPAIEIRRSPAFNAALLPAFHIFCLG